MPQEQEPPLPRLTALRFDYDQAAIILEAEGKPVAQLPFPATGVIFQAPAQVVDAEPVPNPAPPTPALPAEAAEPGFPDGPSRSERNRPITLSGRLKSKPMPGKPDRSGNPTAYARFSSHVEGEEASHYYLATFHRHTAKIALILGKEAQVTVEGYAHPSGSEKRMDTLSVINMVQYPGKPRRRPGN